jgi:hypothetical protein
MDNAVKNHWYSTQRQGVRLTLRDGAGGALQTSAGVEAALAGVREGVRADDEEAGQDEDVGGLNGDAEGASAGARGAPYSRPSEGGFLLRASLAVLQEKCADIVAASAKPSAAGGHAHGSRASGAPAPDLAAVLSEMLPKAVSSVLVEHAHRAGQKFSTWKKGSSWLQLEGAHEGEGGGDAPGPPSVHASPGGAAKRRRTDAGPGGSPSDASRMAGLVTAMLPGGGEVEQQHQQQQQQVGFMALRPLPWLGGGYLLPPALPMPVLAPWGMGPIGGLGFMMHGCGGSIGPQGSNGGGMGFPDCVPPPHPPHSIGGLGRHPSGLGQNLSSGSTGGERYMEGGGGHTPALVGGVHPLGMQRMGSNGSTGGGHMGNGGGSSGSGGGNGHHMGPPPGAQPLRHPTTLARSGESHGSVNSRGSAGETPFYPPFADSFGRTLSDGRTGGSGWRSGPPTVSPPLAASRGGPGLPPAFTNCFPAVFGPVPGAPPTLARS